MRLHGGDVQCKDCGRWKPRSEMQPRSDSRPAPAHKPTISLRPICKECYRSKRRKGARVVAEPPRQPDLLDLVANAPAPPPTPAQVISIVSPDDPDHPHSPDQLRREMGWKRQPQYVIADHISKELGVSLSSNRLGLMLRRKIPVDPAILACCARVLARLPLATSVEPAPRQHRARRTKEKA